LRVFRATSNEVMHLQLKFGRRGRSKQLTASQWTKAHVRRSTGTSGVLDPVR
jgi:hypothetical protein